MIAKNEYGILKFIWQWRQCYRRKRNKRPKTDKLKGIVIIFIENSKGEFLIQKTSTSKKGDYATTGGHVTYGSTFNESIIREVKEELGIDITNEKIIEVYNYIYNKYYQKVFYLKKDIDIKDLTIEDKEVESISWLTKEQIEELIINNKFREGNIEGYKKVLNYIVKYE